MSKIMITGHRPERLGGRELKVEQWLDYKIKELKPTIAISGMAEGVDQIYAKLAIEQNIPLAAALPYKKKWNSYHPVVQDMLTAAREVVYTSEKYSKQAYYIRDCAMVDAADIVLAVWDGKEGGGTWNTIEYAKKQNKTIIYFPWESEDDV